MRSRSGGGGLPAEPLVPPPLPRVSLSPSPSMSIISSSTSLLPPAVLLSGFWPPRRKRLMRLFLADCLSRRGGGVGFNDGPRLLLPDVVNDRQSISLAGIDRFAADL